MFPVSGPELMGVLPSVGRRMEGLVADRGYRWAPCPLTAQGSTFDQSHKWPNKRQRQRHLKIQVNRTLPTNTRPFRNTDQPTHYPRVNSSFLRKVSQLSDVAFAAKTICHWRESLSADGVNPCKNVDISDNWELQIVTIIVTWQQRVPLNNICYFVNVFFWKNPRGFLKISPIGCFLTISGPKSQYNPVLHICLVLNKGQRFPKS